MSLIDFNLSPSHALRRGFIKGLAAPCQLFNVESPPAVPELELLGPVSRSSAFEAFAKDWRRVGGDIEQAIVQYERCSHKD